MMCKDKTAKLVADQLVYKKGMTLAGPVCVAGLLYIPQVAPGIGQTNAEARADWIAKNQHGGLRDLAYATVGEYETWIAESYKKMLDSISISSFLDA